jgi:hypothetical protein
MLHSCSSHSLSPNRLADGSLNTLVGHGWDETVNRKGIVTIAFGMGVFLIAAMRIVHTGLAIWLLIGASLVGLACKFSSPVQIPTASAGAHDSRIARKFPVA